MLLRFKLFLIPHSWSITLIKPCGVTNLSWTLLLIALRDKSLHFFGLSDSFKLFFHLCVCVHHTNIHLSMLGVISWQKYPLMSLFSHTMHRSGSLREYLLPCSPALWMAVWMLIRYCTDNRRTNVCIHAQALFLHMNLFWRHKKTWYHIHSVTQSHVHSHTQNPDRVSVMVSATLISVLAPSCETKTDDNYTVDALPH